MAFISFIKIFERARFSQEEPLNVSQAAIQIQNGKAAAGRCRLRKTQGVRRKTAHAVSGLPAWDYCLTISPVYTEHPLERSVAVGFICHCGSAFVPGRKQAHGYF
jgi:hypothetical protein